MNTDLGMLSIDIHAEGRYETIVGLVEHVEESLVERQTGTKHGSQYDVILGQGMSMVLRGVVMVLGLYSRVFDSS